tara:strand:+ start:58 stop:273 length:216 start_codon:yes stop_codon:yes gene_type:complete
MKLLADMDAGLALRILMTEKKLSREKLAEDLGVSEQTISSLRRNKLMSGRNIALLAQYFNMSASNFIRKGE